MSKLYLDACHKDLLLCALVHKRRGFSVDAHVHLRLCIMQRASLQVEEGTLQNASYKHQATSEPRLFSANWKLPLPFIKAGEKSQGLTDRPLLIYRLSNYIDDASKSLLANRNLDRKFAYQRLPFGMQGTSLFNDPRGTATSHESALWELGTDADSHPNMTPQTAQSVPRWVLPCS